MPAITSSRQGVARQAGATLNRLRDDLHLLTEAPTADVQAVYDRAAPSYDHFRGRWLELAGAEAEAAMLDDLRAALRPGQRVLDAGCGTGAMSRQIVALCPDVELTMLDLSPKMLARAADVPGRHVLGSVLDLPFADNEFDLVVSAWVLETVSDPGRAVDEFLRVLASDGHVVYTFCSLPEGWVSRTVSAPLRAAVKHGFAGDFLDAEHTPWHDCEHSHRRRFHRGLSSEILLRKCCAVGRGLVPTSPKSPQSQIPL